MAYTLPPLPYSFDALEPHIDARTMEIHHDKHHAAYVANVNKALEGSPLAELPIEKLISDLEQLVLRREQRPPRHPFEMVRGREYIFSVAAGSGSAGLSTLDYS